VPNGQTYPGVAAAVIIPRVTGKGIGAAALAAIAGVYLHVLLDAPLAKAMANHGVQFGR